MIRVRMVPFNGVSPEAEGDLVDIRVGSDGAWAVLTNCVQEGRIAKELILPLEVWTPRPLVKLEAAETFKHEVAAHEPVVNDLGQQLHQSIQRSRELAKRLPKGREAALVATKLDEAVLWLAWTHTDEAPKL